MKEIYFQYNSWWENKKENTGFPRTKALEHYNNMLKRKQIEVILGSRRIGKTTFIKQLIKKELENKFPPKNIFYISLDNPAFENITISQHLNNYRKIFNFNREAFIMLVLDEIQECRGWEKEIKALYDLENIKIIISGSTSTLLTIPGSKLTGRQNIYQLLPLNFEEYLLFKNKKVSRSEKYIMENLVEDYIKIGGYPENVLNPSFNYLGNLLNDIIIRDIMVIFKTRRTDIIKSILKLAANSVGSKTSYHKMSNVLGVKLDTLKKYYNFCEQSFLLKSIEKWSTSIKDRIYSYKKFYFYDTGFLNLLMENQNLGVKVENAVLIELLRQKIENIGYYFEGEKEIDFIIGSYNKPIPIESKYINKLNWEDKIFSKLKDFINKHNCKRAYIITESISKEFKYKNAEIIVVPLWEFLLSQNKLQ